MAGSILTAKEQEKASILTAAIDGDITNSHAAKQLHFSIRQVQRAKEEVILETHFSGSVHIMLRERELNYFLLPEKPQKQIQQPAILTTHS